MRPGPSEAQGRNRRARAPLRANPLTFVRQPNSKGNGMKTSSVGASPSRGNGGTVRRQLLKKLKQSPDGGETLDRRQLLSALAELKRGSFDVRLPDGWIGLDGKIADAFNDVVALNQGMSRELERLRRVVGQEG